ncbi:MAG: H-X9-DG-CTERM domain-containing protein [Limisphaerales bacterium]
MHNRIGNVALADGSVQTITSSHLQLILVPPPGRTNWLAVP